MNPSQVQVAACEWAARLTENSFNQAMALYALSYILRLHQGECLNTWALGVVEHWGRQHFPFAVSLAYQSWWAIHLNDNICAL